MENEVTWKTEYCPIESITLMHEGAYKDLTECTIN